MIRPPVGWLRTLTLVCLLLVSLASPSPRVWAQQNDYEIQPLAFWNDHETGSRMRVNHSEWQQLLDTYLDSSHPSGKSRFDYNAVSAPDRERLNRYLDYLQSLEPRQFNLAEQKAFWINLYNAAAVALVLQQRPNLRRFDQISEGFFSPGTWDIKLLNVARQELSLRELSNGILRPVFADPRIHYVINCACLSCPNLPAQAFTGENVETLIEQAARAYIERPGIVRPTADGLILPSIYAWYASDFGADFAALKVHLGNYLEPAMLERLNTYDSASYVYNWTLDRP